MARIGKIGRGTGTFLKGAVGHIGTGGIYTETIKDTTYALSSSFTLGNVIPVIRLLRKKSTYFLRITLLY